MERDAEKIRHPFSLTLFEDSIYWTDWQEGMVKQHNKFHTDNVSVIHVGDNRPMDIHVVHPLRQPKGKEKDYKDLKKITIKIHRPTFRALALRRSESFPVVRRFTFARNSLLCRFTLTKG